LLARVLTEPWGEQQLLPNGNVLITESFAGRVIEVTRETQPRIVWSYVNDLAESGGHQPRHGIVGAARRFAPGELPFVDGPEIAGREAIIPREPAETTGMSPTRG